VIGFTNILYVLVKIIILILLEKFILSFVENDSFADFFISGSVNILNLIKNLGKIWGIYYIIRIIESTRK